MSRFAYEAGEIEIRHKKAQKYSPDQPRDEDGRFASGVGGEAELYEANPAAGMDHRWFDAYEASVMRATLAEPIPAYHSSSPADLHSGNNLIGDGPFIGYRPSEIEDLHSAAAHLVEMANNATPTTADIYRGIGLKGDDYAQFQQELAVGKTVDLNLASWSANEQVATDFAADKYGTQGDSFDRSPDHSVVFDLAAGAHALDVHVEAPSFQQFAKEMLTAGRFRVTSVDHNDDWEPRGPDAPTSTLDTVHLQQVGTLDAGQLMGAKVARATGPARLLPWLERYFDQRMVPPSPSQEGPKNDA